MQLYDTIVLKAPLEGDPIPVGTKGVILMIFESPSKAFEIEFVDVDNETLGTFTVKEEQIELSGV